MDRDFRISGRRNLAAHAPRAACDAAGLFWDDEHSADQQVEAVAAIATHMKFRPQERVALAPDRRAKYLRSFRR